MTTAGNNRLYNWHSHWHTDSQSHWHTTYQHTSSQAHNNGTVVGWHSAAVTAFNQNVQQETSSSLNCSQLDKVHTLVCFSHADCMDTGYTKAAHYTLEQRDSVTQQSLKNRQRFHHHCRATAAVCDIAMSQNKKHGSL